jgi:molybdopterin-guanine dinucleotide biosynthesis protein A
VLTLGCDTPLVPEALLADLAARETPALLDDLPVIGIWPTSLSPLLEDFVVTDPRRSVRGWAARCGAVGVAAGPLANINTPADLDRLG